MQTFKTGFWMCVLGIFPVLALASEPIRQAPASTSLCRDGEQVFFTCAVAGSTEIISLCGSKTLDNRRGYIQYRFGKPGAIELQFPRERANTQLVFHYAHYFRAQVARTEVMFDNGDYNYVVFNYYDGDLKPVNSSAGVRVKKHGTKGPQTELQCQGRATSKLGSLERVIRRDPDNALNQ